MDDRSAEPVARGLDAANPQEHGSRLARNALSLAGNIGIALGSAGPTASIALTLAAVVAASTFASPIAILICGLPMLAIAAAFRRLNRWRVNCGGIYIWGGRAISPYYGFAAGWIVILAYVVGVVSISLPIGPYVVSLFTSATSRPGEAIVGFVAVVLATAVAYVGIRITAWTQWILIAIEYVGVGILAIWCLVSVFSRNPHSVPFSWSWFSWSSMGGVSGFVAASLIAVYLYSGWDTGILVNEETSDSREKPGNAVVTSVIVLAIMYAFLTFALQGAVHTKALEAAPNALSYIAQTVSGSALAKYMILAVALSALGSTLASLVSGVRVTFAMGSDRVLPHAFARTHPVFKTPILATIVIGVIAAIGVWLYTFGSSSVQTSFDTVVSVDGLLFALFYALTGIATAVYFRKLARRSAWNFILVAVFPVAAAAFLAYIMYRSVAGLGGWTGRDLVSMYVMLGIGVVIMLWVRFTGTSDYFSAPRETYQPEGGEVPAADAKAT
jgi:amino acid transporter